MKLTSVLLLLLAVSLVQTYDLSMFYCGFGGNFCGQSTDDDVHPKTTTVILAFVNTQPDGSVIADDANFPTDLISKWHSAGKKVVISVGGQNGNWPNVFASSAATANFINALNEIVKKYNLDGVDLDIENYLATPRTVANMILALRDALGQDKLIIVSPEDVTVMQEFGVPNPDAQTGYYNYFVPIIQLADSAIDYYQPQAYNNWYEVTAGSVDYLKNVYLNWRNLQGLMTWAKPIPNFSGVAGEKLLMGVEASTTAGGSNYYITPDIIA
jgi:chitinase